jgi:hypothetical protein
MIRARCHTVDEAKAVEFDATPWFQEADADTIVLLARQDWSAPWVADALETRAGYEDVGAVIRHARDRLAEETREDPSFLSFECRVNGSDALAWLEQNRPEVAGRLRAEAAGSQERPEQG